MPAQRKSKGINLLPSDKFAKTTTGRVLAWLLTTFRTTVIIVELIVMAAFLSRFWLDAKNSDLNDEIKQKKARIQASSEIEKEMRLVQKRLSVFASLTEEKTSYVEIMQKITPLIPEGAVLKDVTILPTEINITGSAQDEITVMQTVANLESEKSFKNTRLQSVSVSPDEQLNMKFTIGINL